MEVLYIILVLLLVTRGFGEIAVRLGQPELVGQLVGGIVLGALVRQFQPVFPVLAGLEHHEAFRALSELGVFFLMLLGGLEMQPRELRQASGGAFWIALGGLLLPLAAGCLLGWIALPESHWKGAQVLFLGTALAITAIPVAVKVLIDLDQLHTRAGQLIVSAALFDDIFGLVLLGFLTGLLKTGSIPDLSGILILGLKIAAFLGLAGFLGLVVLPLAGRLVRKVWIEEFEFSMLLVVALGFSLMAEALGLHFILGAFLAGLFFTRRTIGKELFHEVETKVTGVTSGFLAPLFFASIGLHLDISALWHIPGFVIILILVALLTKFLGAGLAARAIGINRKEAAGIGVAMSARGAVELIIAGIALDAGLFSPPAPVPLLVQHLFSAVVIMAIVTTVFMPISLRFLLPGRSNNTEATAP